MYEYFEDQSISCAAVGEEVFATVVGACGDLVGDLVGARVGVLTLSLPDPLPLPLPASLPLVEALVGALAADLQQRACVNEPSQHWSLGL